MAAGVPTYYSFPAIMASRYPLALGRDVVGVAPGESTLASVLRDEGYATAAFVAGNPYLSARFGYDSGFESFSDFLKEELGSEVREFEVSTSWRTRTNRSIARACHNLPPLGAAYDELYFQYCQRIASRLEISLDKLQRFPSAQVIVDQALEWLEELGDSPFFMWLHLMDPHAPYYPAEDALNRMGIASCGSRAQYLNSFWNRREISANRCEAHKEDLIALYDAGIRKVDIEIARLVDKLRGSGRWDDSLLAVTADHGEEFLDHGGRFHEPSNVSEELIRVPLLLHAPGMRAGRYIESVFSLLHMGPTLLDAVNAGIPTEFNGRSCWSAVQDGAGFEDYAIIESVAGCGNPLRFSNRLQARMLAVREKRYKLVMDLDTGREDLFDLYGDAGELAPLSCSAERETRRRLLGRAHYHLKDSVCRRNEDHRLAARIRDLQFEWPGPCAQSSAA
jgi:arylsulfatase A-like enzyme